MYGRDALVDDISPVMLIDGKGLAVGSGLLKQRNRGLKNLVNSLEDLI